MNRYEEYNTVFSIDNQIGVILSEEQFQVLMTGGKIYTTIAWMDRGQAFIANGGDILDYKDELRPYCGLIVADSFQEAEQIAIKRGWGESVDGVLHDIMDWETYHSPTNINKSQRN